MFFFLSPYLSFLFLWAPKIYKFSLQQVQLLKADRTVTMFEEDVLQLTFEVIYHEEYHVQIKVCYPCYL